MKSLNNKSFAVFILLLFLSSCQDENPHIKPLSNDAIILAFGDSLTYGTGAEKGESYPAVLANKLNRSVINKGIPGEITALGLKRLPAILDKYRPQLLILCHGANDILRKQDLHMAADNLGQMIQLAQDRNIDVILVGVPEFGLFLNTASFYQDVADEYQLVFINNVLSEILSDASLKADPVHPNKFGYQLLAERIFQTIQRSGAL